MDTLHLPHSKLLYVVNTLHRQHKIDKYQRVYLKTLIMNDNASIQGTLLDNPNQSILAERLIELANCTRDGQKLLHEVEEQTKNKKPLDALLLNTNKGPVPRKSRDTEALLQEVPKYSLSYPPALSGMKENEEETPINYKDT